MIVPEVVNPIVLGAATLLVLVFFIKEIIKTFRRRPTTKPIAIGLVLLGFILLVGLVCNIHEMEWADLAQMLLMIGLIAVTLSYASSAAIQADTSVKMAEEMKKQRYDAVRPVIDIVIIEQSITAREGRLQAYGANPKDLPCKLRNVGVGPAIAVHSFIEDIHDPDGNPRRWDFGNLPSAAGKMEYTQEMRLLLMQKDNQRALVAYYKDVHGNRFESIREVNVHEVVRSRGPIKIRKMAEKESLNDSQSY